MIHRHRGNRRDVDRSKAKRKLRIIGETWGNRSTEGFVFGYFRKGKIHCSCPMCSAKTGGHLNRSNGPVDEGRRSSKMPGTNHRYGKKNYAMSDRRQVDSMRCKAEEFKKT